jgi:hypothetical protein
MHQITVSVPPMFLPAVDELVRLSQSGSREQWLTQVVRGIVFDYQMRKDFAPQQQARAQQLNAFWPGSGVAPSFGSPSP